MAQQQKILVVDDEINNIEVLGELFQDDYQVLFATHGGEALVLARAQLPDMILLDIMMPGMDGREVCARLKADARTQEIPIIFVTAMVSDLDEVMGLELGAVDYIAKPVNPDAVRLRVKTQLDLKEHRDHLERLVEQRTVALVQARDEAKETAQEAVDREQLLWTVLDSSLDAFIMADHQGKIVRFNPSAEKLFGYESARVMGGDLSGMVIPPEGQERHRKAMRAAGENASEGWVPLKRRITSEGVRSDGKRIDLDVAIASVLSQGHPLFTSFMRDMTGSRPLLHALESALRVAEASSREKDLFLANMSHGIRTPMNGVLGMIDLALGTEVVPNVRGFLDQAKASSQLLLRVVDDILEFSRMEAGKMEIKPEPFHLEEVLEALKTLFLGTLEGRKVTLTIHPPPHALGILVGDRLRLQQILINLTGNALKFTREGAVHVRTTLVEETEQGVRLAFAIQDTGIGLSEEQIAKLFTPFVQADGSTTREFGGTGLGLAICKCLVEGMAGEIWAEGTPNVGSTFHFTLLLGRGQPVERDTLHDVMPGEKAGVLPASHGVMPGEKAGVAPDVERPPGGMEGDATGGKQEGVPVTGGTRKGAHVLVVDDDTINQMVAEEILTRVGIHVTLANHGQEAVDILQTRRFDLVLMDVQMPVMDGYEAARTLRREGRFKDLPIVAMTAHALEGDRAACLEAGMNDYLSKPIDVEKLFDVLASWIPPPEARSEVGAVHGQEGEGVRSSGAGKAWHAGST